VQHEPGIRQRQHRAGTPARRKQSKFHDIPCRDTSRFRSVGEKSRLHSLTRTISSITVSIPVHVSERAKAREHRATRHQH
jgi:hypothetical protein